MKIAKRHLLQLIKKLQLPFKPKDAIEIMAEYDSGIPENIEREISFIQFSEAMIKLIIRYKENVVVEKNDKMVPLKLESEGQLTAVQSGVTMSKTDVPASKVSSENTVSDVKCDSGASTRASGSLLQVGFEHWPALCILETYWKDCRLETWIRYMYWKHKKAIGNIFCI